MKIAIAAVLILSSVQSMAAKTIKPATQNYLTIRSVEYKDLTDQYRLKPSEKMMTLIKAESAGKNLANTLSSISMGTDQAEYIVDKIINIGQKIWNVVEKGRPVQKYQNDVASALPAKASTWMDLTNWKQPETKVIGISYKNAYGVEVIHFVYRIILLAGGTVNGVGNYIGYAAVEPIEMTTAYLYTFNAQAVVVNIFNKGTHANPLAGMILTVRWSVETILKKTIGSQTFFMDGLGHIDSAEKTSLK